MWVEAETVTGLYTPGLFGLQPDPVVWQTGPIRSLQRASATRYGREGKLANIHDSIDNGSATVLGMGRLISGYSLSTWKPETSSKYSAQMAVTSTNFRPQLMMFDHFSADMDLNGVYETK